MINLDTLLGITSDKLVVRTRKDDSGDRTFYYYDVIAVKKYGDQVICRDLENPVDALMFALAPNMINEIKELRDKLEKLSEAVSNASTVLHSVVYGKVEEAGG